MVNAIHPQVEQKGKVEQKNKIIDKHTELQVLQGKATEMPTSAQV
jgi:hypothetical protein